MPLNDNLPAENTDPWYSGIVSAWANLKTFVNGLETSLSAKVNSSTYTAGLATKVDTSTYSGHTHPSTSITDFQEAVQDAVNALLAAGTNVTLAYNDAGNSLTITSAGGAGGGLDAEAVRDAIGIAMVGVSPIVVTVNDAADTITISTTATANATDAALRDRATHTGVQAISTITGLQTALDAKVALPADPNADRIFFWDDSVGVGTWLSVGSGLQIIGTTLSSTATPGAATSFDLEMVGGFYDFPATIGAGVIRFNTYGPTAPNSSNTKIAGTVSGTLPTYIGVGAGKARHRWNLDTEVG